MRVQEFLEQIIQLKATMSRPEEWNYLGIEDFVLKNGSIQEFGSLPKEVKQGVSGQCYRNAFLLAQSTPDRFVYCEGFSCHVSVPFPVEHAWCFDLETNKVVEVTWIETKNGGQAAEYLGVMFDLDFVAITIIKKKTYGVIDDWKRRHPLLKSSTTEWKYKG